MNLVTRLRLLNSKTRLLRIVLAAAMVFATWHITSHAVVSDSGAEQCQVCSLSHVPVIDSSTTLGIAPLALLSLILVISTLQHVTQVYRYTPGARAPPQF